MFGVRCWSLDVFPCLHRLLPAAVHSGAVQINQNVARLGTFAGADDAAAFQFVHDARGAALCSPAEVSPAVVAVLGHAPPDKAYLFPLTVDRTTVGILYAAGDVESADLELLAQATAMALEARQRPARREAGAAPADLVNIATAPGNPPAKDWDDLSPADRQLHLRAQRFARVAVAEMRLARPDAVKAGRAQQDLYGALQDAIDRGRNTFRQEFVSACPTMVD